MREELLAIARAAGFEAVDLSLGVACDPEPAVPSAGPAGALEGGYPKSAGSPELRAAAARRMRRRFGVALPPEAVAACVGTKEFIATAALFLSRERDDATRDTVLVPKLCYPTYRAGAELAGLRTVQVPVDGALRMRPDLLPAAETRRALCLWVNSPANPTGVAEPLPALAAWGRAHGVLVLSDEAYADLAWRPGPATVLADGLDGVVAVHSLSKGFNSPGLRVGYYAGDPRIVRGLTERRRTAGLMAAAPSQRAAALLLGDDRLVARQRRRTRRRLTGLIALLREAGLTCAFPDGGMFVWLRAPGGDGEVFARRAARTAGLVLAPGTQYGPAGRPFVRIAATREPEMLRDRIALLAGRPVTALRADELLPPARNRQGAPS
ncbi:aminotransferase class I/II-fold pyridoxal phosphate-dependent enzyme [Streptomyces sp. PRKS01-65]|nr:aminotransferase class I/II-fold pyridoxal phosphate-dependent enzyme [Streptomyces harenosi]NEY30956.1 aminotransferase class I/II-fold pyridoxal phosphate-dependent enzyme [Streptomyces harenosi]